MAVAKTKDDAQYRRAALGLAGLEGITWAVDEETKKPLTGSAFLRWKAKAPEREKEKAKADEKRTQEEQRAERAKEAADAAATRRAAAERSRQEGLAAAKAAEHRAGEEKAGRKKRRSAPKAAAPARVLVRVPARSQAQGGRQQSAPFPLARRSST